MTFRPLTIAESYPLAFKQDLLKKQSEHFINKSMTYRAIEKRLENLPTELNLDTDLSLSFDSNPSQLLFKTYIKNNWRVIIISMLLGGVLWHITQNHTKKSRKKFVK